MSAVLDLWQDRDKRRAVLLSAFLHLSFVLFLAFLVQVPQVEPQETFIVIEVGTPELAEQETQAPAADAPAPQAATPRVADIEAGVPQTSEASPQESPPPAQRTAPEVQQQAAAEPARPEPRAADVPPEPAPTPQAAVPPQASIEAPNLPLTEAPTSTPLPEIAEPELEPQELAQAVRVPLPAVSALVPEARSIAARPNVSVAASRDVPQPRVQASVAAERSLPSPQVQASVAEARAVPLPQAEATVAAPRSVATSPQVSVAAARNVATTPQVSVAGTRSVSVAPQVSVAPARSLAAAPQVSVAASRSMPRPTVSAAVSDIESDRPPGGNGDRAGQTREEEGAQASARGVAAGPAGSPSPSGAPASPTPYTAERQRPVAVLIDNATGYPQTGLREASTVLEMPVEGGLTRLMTVYDDVDPGQVGPVRSARDYFVETAQSMNAILVHDGGAPGAMAAIARSTVPTFNAYDFGVLFVRDNSRSAPYNLYSSGEVLRQAVNRLDLGRTVEVSGRVFRPAEGAGNAQSIRVQYSSVYSSGFAYQPATNLYHWQRNGQAATDAFGEAVLVDAVVVAHIQAHPIPGDTEGRLYIPMAGGEATLFLRGKAIPGRWTPQDGFLFVTEEGQVVDLTPFKHWVLFAPQNARVQRPN